MFLLRCAEAKLQNACTTVGAKSAERIAEADENRIRAWLMSIEFWGTAGETLRPWPISLVGRLRWLKPTICCADWSSA